MRSPLSDVSPRFPTSSPSVRSDAIPFPPLITHTEPKVSRLNGLDPNLFTRSPMNARLSSSIEAMPVLRTSRRHKLPTTDLAGALSTLEPGQFLSATAVELVLSTCCPENARIIDSACFNLSANNMTSSSLRPCGEYVVKVFLPIHYKNHWTLAVLDRYARILTHYNSLPTESTFRDALDRALPIFMSDIAGDQTSFPVAYEKPCTQENSYDCGVHMLLTALGAFVNSVPAKSADTKLWRRIFRALLTDTLQIESHLEGINDAPKDARVGTLGASLDDYKARLTASKLSVASAESALDLLNRISNQIVASTLSWSQLPDICQRFLASLEGGLSDLRPYGRVFAFDQFRELFEAGLSKGEQLREASLQAEKSLRAAISSAQKAKDIRTEDKRRLSLRIREIADVTRKKGQEQLAAAEAEIEAATQLRRLLCEE